MPDDVLPREEQGTRDERTITNCEGDRDGGGDEHEGSNKGENGSGNQSGNVEKNGDDIRDKGAGEIKPRNLQSGNLGRSEDPKRRATPTSNR